MKGDTELWKYRGLTEAGQRHKERGLLCQDRLAYQNSEEIQAIALVDGIGRTDKNIFAGERVAHYLTEFMIGQYSALVEGQDHAEIKRRVLKDIYTIIEELMKEYAMPKEEFASTLMALGINHAAQSYCALHLGDGIIVSRDREIHVLSYPENGFCENQTYLTISEKALKKMKIISGDMEDANEFALISDGGYETAGLSKSVVRLLEREQFSGAAGDDRGFACLKYEAAR